MRPSYSLAAELHSDGSQVFTPNSVPHSLFCFRVEVWAKELGDRLWDLGQVCGLNDLESKSGHSVSYKNKRLKVIREFILISYAPTPNCERLLLSSSCLSVRCLAQLGSHCTDFYEVWYFRIFRKSAEKIRVSLKSDKNIGHFTWRPVYMCDNMSLNSS
jgi:hypothetical protein